MLASVFSVAGAFGPWAGMVRTASGASSVDTAGHLGALRACASIALFQPRISHVRAPFRRALRSTRTVPGATDGRTGLPTSADGRGGAAVDAALKERPLCRVQVHRRDAVRTFSAV